MNCIQYNFLIHAFRSGVFFLVVQHSALALASIHAFPTKDISASFDAQEQTRHLEWERVFQQHLFPKRDIRLTRANVLLPDYPANESPCFTINTIKLEGDTARHFQWALDAAKKAKGPCLEAKGSRLAIDKIQNTK
ncbi:hypothetical protein ACL2XG_20580 [Sodalis sp. RH24]|uniref:hypothetical protein n=1 Tax=unclassified Sodalis (in: enterobacteria) TaxID=2636512 RepID=UPI0039B5E57D